VSGRGRWGFPKTSGMWMGKKWKRIDEMKLLYKYKRNHPIGGK